MLGRGASSGSTGLGLDIARRTAESAGGRLRLHQGTARGLEVELAFPLATQPLATQPLATPLLEGQSPE
jgi:signal transduction histidine kinase